MELFDACYMLVKVNVQWSKMVEIQPLQYFIDKTFTATPPFPPHKQTIKPYKSLLSLLILLLGGDTLRRAFNHIISELPSIALKPQSAKAAVKMKCKVLVIYNS